MATDYGRMFPTMQADFPDCFRLAIGGSSSDKTGMRETIGDRVRKRLDKLGLNPFEAARLGKLERTYISDLLDGRKKTVRTDKIPNLALALNTTVDWLTNGFGPEDVSEPTKPAATVPEPDAPNATEPRPLPPNFGDVTIAVYGQAIGGDDGYFVLNGNKVADVIAPPSLRGIRDAYGVYVVGDSMEPRYMSGETVFVNPKLPVRRGDFVVAQVWHRQEDENPRCYIKRFVRMNSQELVLEQYNPAKELIFPRVTVKAIHRIVMAGDG
jgi:phage repressor protein C with HTH and peptisase S24 domain